VPNDKNSDRYDRPSIAAIKSVSIYIDFGAKTKGAINGVSTYNKVKRSIFKEQH
jgi:hypothetical protein